MHRLLTTLGELIAPSRCAACDMPVAQRTLLCPLCAGSIERISDDAEPLAVVGYGGAMAIVLRRFKYGRRPDLALPLGEILAVRVRDRWDTLGCPEVVVPVPVPRSRLLERGYNQASLLARSVAASVNIGFEPMALGRREGGTKQAALGRRERMSNLVDAFFVRRSRSIRGKRILLVDDVVTTGATVAHCRSVLEEAKVGSVSAAVLARAIRS